MNKAAIFWYGTKVWQYWFFFFWILQNSEFTSRNSDFLTQNSLFTFHNFEVFSEFSVYILQSQLFHWILCTSWILTFFTEFWDYISQFWLFPSVCIPQFWYFFHRILRLHLTIPTFSSCVCGLVRCLKIGKNSQNCEMETRYSEKQSLNYKGKSQNCELKSTFTFFSYFCFVAEISFYNLML